MKDNNNQPEEIEEPSESQESSDDSDLNTLTYEELQQKNEELQEEALRARAELENLKSAYQQKLPILLSTQIQNY